jgi:sulfur-oxidizing protein SoxZ
MTRATRIVMPATAARGQVVEVRTLIRHDMETGHRRDDMGKPIPRDIVHTFTVTYAGETIFRAELFPGVAANPYFAFPTVATETGDFVFTWEDDRGGRTVETRRLTVT